MEDEKRRPRFGSRRFDRILIVVSVVSVFVLAAGIYGVIQASSKSGPPIIPFRLALETSSGRLSQIERIDRDGSIVGLTDASQLDQEPAWSPDGKRLAFVRNGAIWVRDDAGTRVLLQSKSATSPQWSPDGTKIAYADQVPATSHDGFLWIMDADGGNAHPVFDVNGTNPPPANCFGGFAAGWYPAGDRILYRGSFPDGSLAVCSVKTDGTGVQIIVHDAAGKVLNFSPALSPDGTQLAYVSTIDGTPRIYIAKADGSDPRLFFSQTGKQDSPAWSPDGQWLAYSADNLGPTNIFAAHADGTGVIRLTTGLRDTHPSWAANLP